MRQIVAATAILLLASTSVGFAQETHAGRVEPGFIYQYAFTPPAPGQLLATMSWDSNAAKLAMILICTVEGEELAYGVASALLDRFARLEAGVLSTPCRIGVLSATSGANYMINLQWAQAEPSMPQKPMPLSVGSRVIKTVIPGTLAEASSSGSRSGCSWRWTGANRPVRFDMGRLPGAGLDSTRRVHRTRPSYRPTCRVHFARD